MNQKHMLAVLSAQSLNSIREVQVGVIEMANAFLQKADEPIMTRTEFKFAFQSLKTAEIGFNFEGVKIKPKLTNITFNGKNPHLKMAEVLDGKSLFLRHSQLADSFMVEFNCDGKGSTRLPSGEIVNLSLLQVLNNAIEEFGNDEVLSNSGYSRELNYWKLIPMFHPEDANKGLRNYLKEIYRNGLGG